MTARRMRNSRVCKGNSWELGFEKRRARTLSVVSVVVAIDPLSQGISRYGAVSQMDVVLIDSLSIDFGTGYIKRPNT